MTARRLARHTWHRAGALRTAVFILKEQGAACHRFLGTAWRGRTGPGGAEADVLVGRSPAPGGEPARGAAFEVAQQQRREEPRGAVTLRTARGQLQSLLHAVPQAGRQDRRVGKNGFILLCKTGGLWAQLEQSGQHAALLSNPVSPTFPSGSDIPASEGAGQGGEPALSV